MKNEFNLYGLNIEDIIFNLKKLDAIIKMDDYKLDICLIGGTACLLSGLINRVTIDYDLLNLDYSPGVRNYLNFFNPYDLVDFEATTIPRSYGERIVNVFKGDCLNCTILCTEDLVLSKLCRNLERDFQDIDILIKNTDINLIKELIQEVRDDINTRYPRLQENFQLSLDTFRNRYKEISDF